MTKKARVIYSYTCDYCGEPIDNGSVISVFDLAEYWYDEKHFHKDCHDKWYADRQEAKNDKNPA